MMRRLILAAAVLPLLALPASAADIPPEAELALSCSVILSLKGQDARDAGDANSATEWGYRADELDARGRSMLESVGFTPTEAEDVVMNYALIEGFNVGLGAPSFTDEQCFALFE